MRKPVAAAMGSSAAGAMTNRPPSSNNWTLPPALNPSLRRRCLGIRICPFEEIWETGMETSSIFESVYRRLESWSICPSWSHHLLNRRNKQSTSSTRASRHRMGNDEAGRESMACLDANDPCRSKAIRAGPFICGLRIDSIGKTAYACPDVERASQGCFACGDRLRPAPVEGRSLFPVRLRLRERSGGSFGRVPTGMGKTAMTVPGWLWRRRCHDAGESRL